MKKIFSLLFLNFLLIASGHCFIRSNFDSPDSAVVDPETGAFFVSNVNGASTLKDGNGYISKISANGNLVIQKFIGGKKDEPMMNAPKGLLVWGNEIWAADIDAVRVFNKETGKIVKVVDLAPQGAQFLKGIAADSDGKIYVSDVTGDKIFRIDPAKDYKVSVFHAGTDLGNPSGLVFNPKTRSLMVSAFKSGMILEIDRHGKAHVLKKGLSALSGIDYDNGGNLYVSSIDKGEIYRIAIYGRGALTVFQSGLTTPAGISCDRKNNQILIPSYRGNTVGTVFLFDDKSHRK